MGLICFCAGFLIQQYHWLHHVSQYHHRHIKYGWVQLEHNLASCVEQKPLFPLFTTKHFLRPTCILNVGLTVIPNCSKAVHLKLMKVKRFVFVWSWNKLWLFGHGINYDLIIFTTAYMIWAICWATSPVTQVTTSRLLYLWSKMSPFCFITTTPPPHPPPPPPKKGKRSIHHYCMELCVPLLLCL